MERLPSPRRSMPGSKEIAVADPRARRKRPVKGGHGRKRAAYLDWAQEDRDSEGIHLVALGACNGSERYLCGQRSPTTSLAMCTYYRPVFARGRSIFITRFTRSAVSRRDRSRGTRSRRSSRSIT